MFAHIPRWLRIVVYVQAALVIAVPLGGWLLQKQQEESQARQFPPPGKLVDVGGHRLHIYCLGQASEKPTVVFNADSGDSGLVFRKVQEQTAAFTRSCAIDRAGFGWSDPGLDDRGIVTTAKELHAALAAAGEKGPYVLVGHGIGALQMLGFAGLFDADTKAAVLLDPTPPACLKDRFDGIVQSADPTYQAAIKEKLDEVIAERGACPPGEGGTQLYGWLARIGMVRALAGRNFDPTSPSPDMLEMHRALKLRTSHADAVVQESTTCYQGLPEAQSALSRWTSKPLAILTRGRMGSFVEDQEFLTRRGDATLQAYEQAQLAYLKHAHQQMAEAAHGSQSVAGGSAHYVMLSEPELVVNTIRDVWSRSVAGNEAAH